MCDSKTGLCEPLLVCSADSPCDDGAANPPLTTSETDPACKTSASASPTRPLYNDGPPVAWVDPVSGQRRTSCVFDPGRNDGGAPVPLLIFFHGSQASADMVYDDTSLRTKATSYPLGGSKRRGFALASVQGRNLHWPDPTAEGAHHDFFFRDGATATANPDVRAADELVDALVAGGDIDPKRIFVTGWSNGAFFAEEYGIFRFNHPTPGGNRVAAVAVYAGGDPFDQIPGSSNSPMCQLASYPSASVPLMVVHRDCDAQVACDSAQQMAFGLPPGFWVEDWLTQLANLDDSQASMATTVGAGGSWVSGGDLLLTASGAQTATCAKPSGCTKTQGNTNHHAWPDGVADGSGMDWEPALLSFLAAHPLP